MLCKFEKDVSDLSQRVLCDLHAGLPWSSCDGRGAWMKLCFSAESFPASRQGEKVFCCSGEECFMLWGGGIV